VSESALRRLMDLASVVTSLTLSQNASPDRGRPRRRIRYPVYRTAAGGAVA
jgi:hypothetical protein